MVHADAPGGDVLDTGVVQRAECVREISDLWPTLMHRVPGTERAPASDTASPVIVGTTPNRGPSSWKSSASSGSQL